MCDVGGLSSSPSASAMVGISGKCASSNNDASSASHIYGLDFLAYAGRSTGSPTVTELIGALTSFGMIGDGITVTDAAGFKPTRYTSFYASVIRAMGAWIPDISKSIDTTVYGLRVDDQPLGTNRYLAWFGPATPRMRLDAGTPGANQTMLHLAEGTTPTLRRVQWKDGASIGAGDKVMVLV